MRNVSDRVLSLQARFVIIVVLLYLSTAFRICSIEKVVRALVLAFSRGYFKGQLQRATSTGYFNGV